MGSARLKALAVAESLAVKATATCIDRPAAPSSWHCRSTAQGRALCSLDADRRRRLDTGYLLWQRRAFRYREFALFGLDLCQVLHGFCRSQVVPRKCAKGHKRNFGIQPRRSVPNVPIINLLFIFLAEELGAIDLRPSRNARPDGQSQSRVGRLILRKQRS